MLFKVTNVSTGNFSCHTLSIPKGGSKDVDAISAELVKARNDGKITITPNPVVNTNLFNMTDGSGATVNTSGYLAPGATDNNVATIAAQVNTLSMAVENLQKIVEGMLINPSTH